jgi:hypothetical protein
VGKQKVVVIKVPSLKGMSDLQRRQIARRIREQVRASQSPPDKSVAQTP